MRPAILIIIMDFLVSSLLLFITGPDNWQVAAGAGARATAPAPDFAPAAIADMEALWMRESQDALISHKLLTQEKTIAQLNRKSSDLEFVKSSLETTLTGQRQELQTRQQELEQKAKEAEVLKQEQQRMATTVHEHEKTITSQQESIASLARNTRSLEEINKKQEQVQSALKDIQTDQKTISTNLLTLQQQETVTQIKITDVAERQVLMNTRIGDLQTAQARMETTLQSVNTLAANLPQAMRASLQDIAANQQQLEASVSSLTESVPALNTVGTADEFKGFDAKLDAMAAQHMALQDALQTVITGRTDQLVSGIAAVRQNQDALQAQIKGLASKVEDIGAKRPGPFRPFRDARVELRVSLTQEYRDSDISGQQFDTHAAVVYPPLLSAADGLWLAAGYKDLGLNWPGASSSLRHVYYRIARRGGAGTSALLKGPLQALADNPRVVLIGFSLTNDPQLTAAGITNVAPMKILGRPALEKRGTGGLHLFKRSSEGLSFAIEASFDMHDPRYLVIRRNLRAWASIFQNAFTNPNARPETGDFVVTEEGAFIGLMVDNQRCLVLDTAPLAAGARAIPLDTVPAFVNQISKFRRSLK
ncbi:MAG: hypothetical protein KJ964_07910 [Verrucomicrobia bacterium]|nr:hypothetical protein [Verrucomicrobiota bacterium]MBU1733737.1 hypothetical protein [Verrucomicrobiota bacterium]MBU1855422.1 hypothetical protein [Verrucomicrobiota bacterium]